MRALWLAVILLFSAACGDEVALADASVMDASAESGSRLDLAFAQPDLTGVALPTWVPAAGAIVALTNGNGKLTNHFRDVIVPYYDAFYSIKIVNDYSTAIADPWLGPYGGGVFFGGGHAGTNDNSTVGLIAAASNLTFARLSDPTPWFGSTPANAAANDTMTVSGLTDPMYGDAVSSVDTQPRPLSQHTYGYGDIVPPSEGGASHGTYFQPLVAAGGVGGAGYGGAHQLAIASNSDPNVNTWTRAGATVTGFGANLNGPNFSVYVPPQKRSYWTARNVTKTQWFDHATLMHVAGTGDAVTNQDSDDPDNGVLLYVPGRDLVVGLFRVGGVVRVQWMDVAAAVSQPSLGGTATLSLPLPLQPSSGVHAWHHAFYCPDTNKIVLGKILTTGGVLDDAAVYEIDLPTTLSDAWTVTRRPFTEGTMTWPDTWQGFWYLPAIRTALIMPTAANDGDDTVYAFRPHGT